MAASAVGTVRQSCLLNTPEQRQEYRQSLHKSGGNSPAWKDTYRKACIVDLYVRTECAAA